MKASAGRQGKTQHHSLAPRGIEPCHGRVAQDHGAEAIRHHQPAFLRDQVGRKIGTDGEEEGIAERLIFRPFLIGAKIRDRAFDLNDDDIAGVVDRHHIGAPSGNQPELRQTGITALDQGAPHSPRQHVGHTGDTRRSGFLDFQTCSPNFIQAYRIPVRIMNKSCVSAKR